MFLNFLIMIVIAFGAGMFYFFKIKPKMNPANRALSFIRQMRYEDAVTEYKRILYSRPGDSNTHFHIADLYLQLKKYDEAIFHLNEIIRIDRYGYEVEKLDVLKKLAKAYLLTSNGTEALQTFINILSIYPEDAEALYHVSFSILGQEEFDLALRYFTRLIKFHDSFENYFGIGICNYQIEKYDEAVKYFREALSLKPDSEIANLAIAFALIRLENYKEAVTYAKKLAGGAGGDNVKFIAMRVLSYLLLQSGRESESIGVMEKMLDMERAKDIEEELKLMLYDIGFACVKAGKPNKALGYWKELQSIDGQYKNLDALLNLLDREINEKGGEDKDSFQVYVSDSSDEWLSGMFPGNFLWEICGLRSGKKIDIKNMLMTTRVSGTKGEASAEVPADTMDFSDRTEKFCGMNTENFKVVAGRLVAKMGYKVEEFLQTYRDADGVDFLARAEGQKVLIWIRRWRGTMVGEIPIRNFAQAINDMRAAKGVFVTTAELNEQAKNSLKKLPMVTIVYPKEVNTLLRGLIQL